MELTIQTQHHGDTIRIELAPITGAIILTVTEGEYSSRVFLSVFEAQIIGGALLQMVSKLEYPHDAMDIEAEEKAAKQEAVRVIEVQSFEKTIKPKPREMTINEQITDIFPLANGGRQLEMRNQMTVFVSAEVWAKESHLLSDYESASSTHMNIREYGAGDWELVDCVPF